MKNTNNDGVKVFFGAAGQMMNESGHKNLLLKKK